jgi:hypothetical protein
MTARGEQARRAWLTGLACCAAACAQPELPGELVGAYHVQGALTENSCGSSALPAVEQLSFDVELRKDDAGRGIWLRGMPPARYGKLDADGAFQFDLENTYPVDLSQGQGAPDRLLDPDLEGDELLDPERYDRLDRESMQTCALIVSERISGMLLRDTSEETDTPQDGGDNADGGDLLGENSITIRAASGSHCEPVLSTFGGPFEDLPCSAHYDLTGTLAE